MEPRRAVVPRATERPKLRLRAAAPQTAADAVRQVLTQGAGQSASAEAIAIALGLHLRTLERRLTREGTSVRRLQAQQRHAAACFLLRETDAPLAAIAERLGYADSSAFARAFRRWSGTTPASWRRLSRITPAVRRDAGSATGSRRKLPDSTPRSDRAR